ncbi:hypothetical protein GQ457_17G010560 [Hibiscus cannabinus]
MIVGKKESARGSKTQSMLVQFVLEPLWQAYHTALELKVSKGTLEEVIKDLQILLQSVKILLAIYVEVANPKDMHFPLTLYLISSKELANYTLIVNAMSGHSSATYCLCKDGVGDQQLQKTLNYACGNGADWSAILQKGGCYNSNTVKDHYSNAVNNYFLRKGQAQGSCDFLGTATVGANPPPNVALTCNFPSSSTGTSTCTTPTGTTIGSTTESTPTIVISRMWHVFLMLYIRLPGNNESGQHLHGGFDSHLNLTSSAKVSPKFHRSSRSGTKPNTGIG